MIPAILIILIVHIIIAVRRMFIKILSVVINGREWFKVIVPVLLPCFKIKCNGLLDKLEFGGQCPLTTRAWCSTFRYCPDPLGIFIAQQFDKLEFI